MLRWQTTTPGAKTDKLISCRNTRALLAKFRRLARHVVSRRASRAPSTAFNEKLSFERMKNRNKRQTNICLRCYDRDTFYRTMRGVIDWWPFISRNTMFNKSVINYCESNGYKLNYGKRERASLIVQHRTVNRYSSAWLAKFIVSIKFDQSFSSFDDS